MLLVGFVSEQGLVGELGGMNYATSAKPIC